MKKLIGKCLRKILPWHVYKLVANGFIIVPKYYKGIIEDAERARDLSLQESPGKTMLLLRKYAHIIDKGLHREDAEPGHSKSYYALLCAALQELKGSDYEKDPTYGWALSKKQAYERLQSGNVDSYPLRGKEHTTTITYEDLFKLMQQRRSNRFFLPKLLPDEVIRNLKVTAHWASNSCNKQPIRLFVTNDPELAKKCLACCKGGTGFGDFIPSFWAFCADVRGYVWPMELYLPGIDVSLGAQNLFLAAQTMGVSGTILTWAQKDSQDELLLRKYLNIPEEYNIIFCSVLGYAKIESCTPIRKNDL